MALAREAPVVQSQPDAALDPDATRPNESIPLLMASLSEAYGLTPRERAIARMVFLGFDLSSIAKRLELSEKMASWQLQDVFAKTGTDGAKSLIRLALDHARELDKADAPTRAMPRWDNVNGEDPDQGEST